MSYKLREFLRTASHEEKVKRIDVNRDLLPRVHSAEVRSDLWEEIREIELDLMADAQLRHFTEKTSLDDRISDAIRLLNTFKHRRAIKAVKHWLFKLETMRFIQDA